MKRIILLTLSVALSSNAFSEEKVKTNQIQKNPVTNKNCEYKANGDYNCKNVITTKKNTTVYSSSKKTTTQIPILKTTEKKVTTTPIQQIKKEEIKPLPAKKEIEEKLQTKIVPVVTTVVVPIPVIEVPAAIVVKEKEQYIFSDYKLESILVKEKFSYNNKIKFHDLTLSENAKMASANNISMNLPTNNYIDYENSKSMIKLVVDENNKIVNITKIKIFDNADNCLDESDKHTENFSKIKTDYKYNVNCYSRDNESFIMKLEGKI